MQRHQLGRQPFGINRVVEWSELAGRCLRYFVDKIRARIYRRCRVILQQHRLLPFGQRFTDGRAQFGFYPENHHLFIGVDAGSEHPHFGKA